MQKGCTQETKMMKHTRRGLSDLIQGEKSLEKIWKKIKDIL